jgi:biuret amidohydrolase
MQRAYGLDVPQTLEDVVHPTRMGLLVHDMQAGILPQIPTAAEVTARVGEVLRAAREGGYRVFFTRHMSLPTEVSGVAQLRTAMAWQRVESIGDLSEAIFDKIGMSVFVGTPLEIALRDCRLVALAVVGVALEVGIEPTVRHAADLGLIPIVVADACGSRDDAARARALDGFAFAGDAMITEASALCALLSRAAVPASA